MIYLDSSALLKLLHAERESYALAHWLADHDLPWVSSVVGQVEVPRASGRVNPGSVAAARHLMESVDAIPLGPEVVVDATLLPDPDLRSLDAIHLASALVIRDAIDWFVTYDRRLAAGATNAGLPVLSPGA
jgi:uncharacterized protein